MLTREGLQFLLRITDYFGGKWEDPGWGHRPANQLLLLASLETLVGGIADAEVRRSLQQTIDRAMGTTAQGLHGRAAA
jgi:hypothetical protein